MKKAVVPFKMTKMKQMTATMKQGQPIAIAKKRVRDAASPELHSLCHRTLAVEWVFCGTTRKIVLPFSFGQHYAGRAAARALPQDRQSAHG